MHLLPDGSPDLSPGNRGACVYRNICECFPAHNFVSSSVAVSADRIMGVLRQRFYACTLTHGESLSGFGLIPLITHPSDYT